MNLDHLLTVVAAFLIGLGSAFALRPLLSRAGVIDVPNARSSHTRPVIRGGGLAQANAMVLVLGFLGLASTGSDRFLLLSVAAVSLAAATLGWLEDLRGVRITTRAGAQFLIGVLAASAVALYSHDSLVWGLVGGIALIGGINVVNFMDGVNGISAFHAIVAGLTFVVIGNLDGSHWLVTVGAVLAASFAAFLPWNLGGRMFLGDVGSYLLGGSITITIAVAWMTGSSVIALVSPMAIYVADTALTLVGRILAGEKWYDAHRDHTYQRLNRIGASHLAVASLVTLASALTAVAGVTSANTTGTARMTAYVALAVVIGLYALLRARLGTLLDRAEPVGC